MAVDGARQKISALLERLMGRLNYAPALSVAGPVVPVRISGIVPAAAGYCTPADRASLIEDQLLQHDPGHSRVARQGAGSRRSDVHVCHALWSPYEATGSLSPIAV